MSVLVNKQYIVQKNIKESTIENMTFLGEWTMFCEIYSNENEKKNKIFIQLIYNTMLYNISYINSFLPPNVGMYYLCCSTKIHIQCFTSTYSYFN